MRRPLAKLIAIATVGLAALGSVAGASAATTGVPNRDADPVVLKGSDVAGLIGIAPNSLVAFAYDGGWKQIPVQVDERAMVDYPTVRQGYQTSGRPFKHEAYTDPNTFAGADPDPTLDAGDEIAMMAKDAGADGADIQSPDGVDESTRTEVAVSDPLDAASNRFIYLFRTNAGLDPAAGKSYVDYDFSLNSGDYKTTYSFSGTPNGDDGNPTGGPANPENSRVTTSAYSQHLLARWIADEIEVTKGAATGVDILDGDKAQVGRGCGRSELTFSRGGGGFIANTSGPVRAIRSQIGANSGTYTQRDDIYYESRQDTFTYLRVHPGISQISQYLDYSANAIGMKYANSAYPGGVTIDGASDSATIPIPPSNGLQPATTWETATGPQGALSTVVRVDTDVPGFTAGSFYRDLGAGPFDYLQCGGYGDALSYGTSGSEFKSSGSNTDPTLAAPVYHLTASRSIYYDAPFANIAAATGKAMQRSQQTDNPLEAAAKAEQEPPAPVLKVRVNGPDRPIKPGHSARFKVRVGNSGGPATNVEICPKGPKRLVDIGDCKGSKATVPRNIRKSFRVEVGRRARRPIRIRFKATADGAKAARDSARIQIKR